VASIRTDSSTALIFIFLNYPHPQREFWWIDSILFGIFIIPILA
jgi:hypothetical protein